jgi:regulator of RNase E activity RraA
MCTRFKTAGGVAVVTDGSVRDLPGLIRLEFPIFAAGVPAALEQQVAELARLQDELDNFSIDKITSGVPLARAYPLDALDAELRAEFDATH